MTLLFLTKTKHGNKNQMLWNFTQQIKMSSGWLLQRTRHFQKIRNFKKTKTHNRKNDESAIGNFPTFTWWTFKKWLKTQSNQRSSNRSKNEKSFNPWSDGLTNGSFARWFSACDLCEKCKLWISFTRNEYLSVEFFVWIYLHFLTRLFRVSWKFEKWSRMLNSCNQQQTNQKTQLTGLKNRIWFHSCWIKNDFHSWTQKWNLECHQKISKKLVIILNALVFLFVVKTMQGSWTKMWRVMFLKKSLRVQTPMTCLPPYSVTEIHSPFKNCKTAPELIKTNKKPNENDVKTMSFFLKTKTDHDDPSSYGLQTRKDLQLFFIDFEMVFNQKFYIKPTTFPILSLDDLVQDDFIILAELLWCINFPLPVSPLWMLPCFRQRPQNQWTMDQLWCLWNPKFPNISNQTHRFPIVVWRRQMIFRKRTMFLINPCFPCFVVVNLQIKRSFFWNRSFKERLHVTVLFRFVYKPSQFHRRTFPLMFLRFT